MDRIQDRALGRWRALLPLIGIGTEFLTGRHSACPMCGGHDRWRFDDEGGKGTWICSHCGSGGGVDLVMKFKGISFIEAKKEIEKYIGEAQVFVPKASKSEAQREEADRDRMAALWHRANCLNCSDVASRYLHGRGIKLEEWPASLRWIDELAYWSEEKIKTVYPGMLAKFVAPDNSRAILHRTYLCEPGKKANIPKPKMLMPGKVPSGGAVRLGKASEIMGVAEGIETALSAQLLFDMPVWATLSTGNMIKWQPPKVARTIYIYADNDGNYAGQAAAYNLAHRLKMENEDMTIEVRLPTFLRQDWNDFLVENVR